MAEFGPATGAAAADTDTAPDRPGAMPIRGSDPSLSDLPQDADGDRVPLQYVNGGGATGEPGDLVVAIPDGSGGLSVVVSASISVSVSGVAAPTTSF